MEIEREDKKINDGVNVEVTVEYNDTNSTSYICLIKVMSLKHNTKYKLKTDRKSVV